MKINNKNMINKKNENQKILWSIYNLFWFIKSMKKVF